GTGDGTGYLESSPAIDGDVLYVGSSNHLLYAFGIDGCAAAGSCQPLWVGRTRGIIVSSPAVSGGLVYVGSEDGNLYAFGAAGCGAAVCDSVWTGVTHRPIDSSPT